jgi:hypothetical protein
MRRLHFVKASGNRFGPWKLSSGKAFDVGRYRLICANPEEWNAINKPPSSFHPCEVCGAPASNYCTSCGSEQLANTE